MCLADALKVLLKIMLSTETIISTTASQGKNDVAEASVIILDLDNSDNFLLVGKSWARLSPPSIKCIPIDELMII